jgi:predicted NAD-dependent protein-ADP-ribosyltransferase YbiA (DUF1768 family)
MYNPNQEGISHINAYSKSNLELGRMLSNFAYTPFKCVDGSFQSIEGYWYWLSTDHVDKDELRYVYGFKAKQLGRQLRGNDWPEDEGFQDRIFRACWQKILQNPELKVLLRESRLPIVHYYEYGGKVVVPDKGLWIWEWYERARTYLKENPDI